MDKETLVNFQQRFEHIMHDMKELSDDIQKEMNEINLFLQNPALKITLMQVLQEEESIPDRKRYRTKWLNAIRNLELVTIEDLMKCNKNYFHNIGKHSFDYMNEKLSKYNLGIY